MPDIYAKWIEFTVTILIYLTAIAISEEFEIFRVRPSGADGWIFARDSFKIPPSLCNHGGMNCAHFNAHTKSACYCLCPYREATFMLVRNDWRCLSNFRARQLLGYNLTHYFQFDTERLNYPIRVVYFNDYKRVSLNPSLKNCRVDVGSSRHIGCCGSEVPFNNTNLFSIVPDGDPRDSPPYFLQVNGGATNTELLEGQIIKLGVVCNGATNSWLLLKYVGDIKCLAPTLPPKATTKPGNRNFKLFPSKGTGMAGNTVIDWKLIRSASLSMPVVYTAMPNRSDIRLTVSDVRPTVCDVHPTVSETVFDVQLIAPTSPGREQGIDDSRSSVGLIAGLTASILAVFIIIGFFAYRRCYLKGSLNQQKRPTLPQAQSDTILSEEITWLERQPTNDSRNLILGSVKAIPTNGCNNQVITTGSCESSDATDTLSRPPDTSLYHGLEGLEGTGTIMNRALSALDEQSSERPRSDSDYEGPVLKGACAAIGSQSKGREKEAVYENANPTILTDAAGSSDTLDGNDEYCYSYTTDLSLKDEKSRSDEEPKTDGPLHHSLEGPNTGYEALEGALAMTNDEYTPMEGLSELSCYQPLQKPTRPVYQSLRKTTTEAPRGAFKRK